jgi:hypothetical protein
LTPRLLLCRQKKRQVRSSFLVVIHEIRKGRWSLGKARGSFSLILSQFVLLEGEDFASTTKFHIDGKNGRQTEWNTFPWRRCGKRRRTAKSSIFTSFHHHLLSFTTLSCLVRDSSSCCGGRTNSICGTFSSKRYKEPRTRRRGIPVLYLSSTSG